MSEKGQYLGDICLAVSEYNIVTTSYIFMWVPGRPTVCTIVPMISRRIIWGHQLRVQDQVSRRMHSVSRICRNCWLTALPASLRLDLFSLLWGLTLWKYLVWGCLFFFVSIKCLFIMHCSGEIMVSFAKQFFFLTAFSWTPLWFKHFYKNFLLNWKVIFKVHLAEGDEGCVKVTVSFIPGEVEPGEN